MSGRNLALQRLAPNLAACLIVRACKVQGPPVEGRMSSIIHGVAGPFCVSRFGIMLAM